MSLETTATVDATKASPADAEPTDTDTTLVHEVATWNDDRLRALTYEVAAQTLGRLIQAYARQETVTNRAHAVAGAEDEVLRTIGKQAERLKGAVNQKLAALKVRS